MLIYQILLNGAQQLWTALLERILVKKWTDSHLFLTHLPILSSFKLHYIRIYYIFNIYGLLAHVKYSKLNEFMKKSARLPSTIALPVWFPLFAENWLLIFKSVFCYLTTLVFGSVLCLASSFARGRRSELLKHPTVPCLRHDLMGTLVFEQLYLLI